MPSLRDRQLAFAERLVSPAAAGRDLTILVGPGSAGCAAAQFDTRLAIYRANGRANYRNALAATYPVVKRLTGAPFFDAVVDAFVAAHPPVAGDLNIYGERLAGFLERYSPAADLPYLPDVARLEWAIDEANRAADALRAPDAVLAVLSIIAPERLPQVRLALGGSCRLITSAFPILRIWRANQPDRAGDERISQDEGGIALLVRRDPQGVALESLDAGEQAWIAALAQRATLGAAMDAAFAADPSFDLGATLRAHIAAGTIAAVIDR
ncbi:MAG: DNA-binding domain-containing protein [Casimicrobiaceae bacterium]